MREDPGRDTFVGLLDRRAASRPHAVAVRAVRGDRVVAEIGFEPLALRARAIGARLQREGMAGRHALLVYPQGIEAAAALLGCFLAEGIATFAPLPLADRSLASLGRLARRVGVRHLLTTRRIPEPLAAALRRTPALSGATWIVTDEVESGWAAGLRPTRPGPDALAVVLESALVDGRPGLLALTHRELLDRTRAYAGGCGEGEAALTWLPPDVDMGLVGGALQAVAAGAGVVLMSSLDVLQRPLRWLEWISRSRATVSGAGCLAYELCATDAGQATRDLDLSHWSRAVVGVEGLRPGVLERFARVFEPFGFRRQAFSVRAARARAETPGKGALGWFGARGEPGPGDIAIVSPEARVRVRGAARGEIWIRTHAVAEAFWGARREPSVRWPDRTADTGEGPYFRTGRLGSLRGGDLEGHGALPDALQLPGGAVAAGEVERVVEGAHRGLVPGGTVAFGVGSAGRQRLTVLVETTRATSRASSQEIRGAVADALREVLGVVGADVALLPARSLDAHGDPGERRARARSRYLWSRISARAASRGSGPNPS